LNKKYLLVGDPNYCKNHNLIGHLFNDKAVVGLDRKTYNQQLNNCYIQNTEIYTAREIKKGEELSFSYGENYWYHKNFSGKKRINDIF
jgi:SET domain-containing protein